MITYLKIRPGMAGPFLLLLLLAILPTGCRMQSPAPEPVRLTIAFQDWVGYSQFYLAQDKGFFKEEGIELVFIDEQLDSARRDAFKQGMLDCEAGTLDLLVSKAAQDTPIVAVMELDHSFGSDGIVASADIVKLEDLTGKKVALARDDVGEIFLAYLLSQKGLALTNITIIPTRPEEAAQAFTGGKADACATWEPHLSEALQRPGAHLLASTREYPDIIIDTLNVRRDLIGRNPELVKKLMRGWFKALKFYREEPDAASAIIARYYKITPGEYRKQAEGLKWIDYREQEAPAKYQQWLEAFNRVAGVKSANGGIPRKPEAQEFLNHALLETLYE